MLRKNLNFYTVDVLSQCQLPENHENSDDEADYDACLEFQELDPLGTSTSSCDVACVGPDPLNTSISSNGNRSFGHIYIIP